MKWFNQSLFRRLLFSFLIVFLLGFSLIGIVIAHSTADYITSQKRMEMLTYARNVNGAILHETDVNANVKNTIEHLASFSETTIWLINDTGEIVATSSEQDLFLGEFINDELMEQILNGGTSFQVMNIEDEERPMLSVAVPWGTTEQIHGAIIMHSPVSGIKSTVRNIREIILWASISGLLIVGLLVSYLSWSISKPLRKIEEAANEIALGNYKKRVYHSVPDEIGELVNSFNRMAAKLYDIEKERGTLENRRKDFIANISHELRTPLTAMKGFLEALQDGLVKDKESQQRYYEIMYRETEYLQYLVDDLMDLIKLEEKQVTLDLYFVQIDDVIKKVAVQLEPSFEEKGNTFTLVAPEYIPTITGDSLRLEQIFKNLIHNANKFTEDGQVIANIEQQDDDIVVQIIDTGKGIPSYDLNRIWERFFKVDRIRTKKGRGTGLGLAIVKELVELHHGTITVESEIGKGTTFSIRFPTNRQDNL
ncbi:sensor histidine kinase [Bacillus alkalicellulosilyticus]|uniref:sensor histidine kinase n=1 Tax=Alkalihalobacterium alkalicellulosilyticum TaxID=1912214 RepID=UPI00148231AB|nr:ATP-binding protein [Bacillus alkalicellulosilyticus]